MATSTCQFDKTHCQRTIHENVSTFISDSILVKNLKIQLNQNVSLATIREILRPKDFVPPIKKKLSSQPPGTSLSPLKEEFSKKKFRNVTHCIFDMDGTVLDSEIMYHQLMKKICDKYGKSYTKELQVRMYGVTDREICTTVVKELKLPISADELELQLSTLANTQLPSAPLLKGAERLLTHLYDYKVPMALATNSTEQAVRLHATARPKLFGMFHHKVSATDPEVDRGKPNPDIFLVAAARFPDKPKPSQCLVFEDSAVGVKAGIEAGMQVVMIPDRRLDRELTRQATLVIRSLLEFKPELFGLPPFQDCPPDRAPGEGGEGGHHRLS